MKDECLYSVPENMLYILKILFEKIYFEKLVLKNI